MYVLGYRHIMLWLVNIFSNSYERKKMMLAAILLLSILKVIFYVCHWKKNLSPYFCLSSLPLTFIRSYTNTWVSKRSQSCHLKEPLHSFWNILWHYHEHITRRITRGRKGGRGRKRKRRERRTNRERRERGKKTNKNWKKKLS